MPVLHFYDSSPYLTDIKRRYLKAAYALSDPHIKCLLLEKDALAYIRFIPTGLLGLRLVVPDQDLQRASTEITQSLRYKISAPFSMATWGAFAFDAGQTMTFPHSALLGMIVPDDKRYMDSDSEMVYIHPRS